MKRVRVAPGQLVRVSDALAEKAERVLKSGLTQEQLSRLKAVKVPRFSGVMAGSHKPLRLSKPKK